MQVSRGVAGEFVQNGFAPGRSEGRERGHCHNRRVIGISADQAGILWQQIYREICIHSPEEPVAPFQVALPFVISLKIRAAGFAFDDPDLTFWPQRHDIDAQAGGGNEFLDRNEIMAAQVPADAPRNALASSWG